VCCTDCNDKRGADSTHAQFLIKTRLGLIPGFMRVSKYFDPAMLMLGTAMACAGARQRIKDMQD
jgi:hypothetical protein